MKTKHPKTSTNDNSKNGYIEFAHQAKQLLVATLLHLGSCHGTNRSLCEAMSITKVPSTVRYVV